MYLIRYGMLFPQPPSLFPPELRIMGNSPKIGYFNSNGELSSSSIVPPEKLDWNFRKDTFSNKMPSAVYFCLVPVIASGVLGEFPTHSCSLGEMSQEQKGSLALRAMFSVPDLLLFSPVTKDWIFKIEFMSVSPSSLPVLLNSECPFRMRALNKTNFNTPYSFLDVVLNQLRHILLGFRWKIGVLNLLISRNNFYT